ncbi:MAG: alpha/beta hydrolase fold protein [Solirubrobacterales bacterium]|nr:alpha/beta hydrolase fold protein [Solirubrobacterales bacterium]
MSAPRTQDARELDVSVGEALRKIAADTGFALKLATNRVELPPPTPADGPDPYGSPDPEWLGIGWSAHRHQIDVVGTRVNYVEMGEGPPLVFVHGLSGAWQNWLENLPHFASTHRAIALDLPGFGSSPMPRWDITIPAYGRFLRDFCERIGVGTCVLVGNSMGGFIATEVAVAEPDRVSKLVLVSAAGITWARARREPAAMVGRMVRAATPMTMRWQLGAGIRRPRARRLSFQGVFHDPNALRRELLWENIVPALNSPGYLDAFTNLVGYDIRHRLEEIEVPTLVVWGRNDRVVPVPAAFSYQRRIGSNARLEIFDGTGHVPQLERPVRFNGLLEEFLAE